MSSKLIAMSITYPYQVVRSRAQVRTTVDGSEVRIFQIIKRTWRGEGIRGFYKGIVPSALRVLPGTGITFLIYENCTKYLRNQ